VFSPEALAAETRKQAEVRLPVPAVSAQPAAAAQGTVGWRQRPRQVLGESRESFAQRLANWQAQLNEAQVAPASNWISR
jgi:hypothetical protein